MPNISSLVNKTDYNTKITEIEKKLTENNHDKYITTPVFNILAANAFNVRLEQKQIFMPNGQILIGKLPQIKQNIGLLKMNLKN